LGNPTRHSRDVLRKAKGDHLDRVHSDQMVLKIIRWGRPVLVIGGQESQTNSRDHQAQVHSDQMVLVMATWEAGLCEWMLNSRATFSDDANKRVGKQLLVAKKPKWKRGRETA
jgi:hypothetical protein